MWIIRSINGNCHAHNQYTLDTIKMLKYFLCNYYRNFHNNSIWGQSLYYLSFHNSPYILSRNCEILNLETIVCIHLLQRNVYTKRLNVCMNIHMCPNFSSNNNTEQQNLHCLLSCVVMLPQLLHTQANCWMYSYREIAVAF